MYCRAEIHDRGRTNPHTPKQLVEQEYFEQMLYFNVHKGHLYLSESWFFEVFIFMWMFPSLATLSEGAGAWHPPLGKGQLGSALTVHCEFHIF